MVSRNRSELSVNIRDFFSRRSVVNIDNIPVQPFSSPLVFRTQMTVREFRTELRTNPVLAAAASCLSGDRAPGGEPGDSALREVARRRDMVNSKARQDGATDNHGGEGDDSLDTITWRDFVRVFIPLGTMERDEDENGMTGGGEVGNKESTTAWPAGQQSGDRVAMETDSDELELLRVAYLTKVSDSHARGSGGVLSLAELRAASAELDGEEPPEEPVRNVFGVRKCSSIGLS